MTVAAAVAAVAAVAAAAEDSDSAMDVYAAGRCQP